MSRADEINDTAAQWVARSDAGPLDAVEQSELNQWLAASPRHFGAYERLQAISIRLHRIRRTGRALQDVESQLPNANPTASSRENVYDYPDVEDSRPFNRRAALAASVSGVLLLGLFGWRTPAAAETFRTARGEVRRIPLGDGSTITLNTASAVKLVRDDHSLTLLEGEAFAELKGSEGAPFKISAGRLTMTCSHTEFCINRISEERSVLLIQRGAVHILVGNDRSVVASAGTKVVLHPDNKLILSDITPGDLESQLLWRQGMITFSGTSLFDAAQTFRRYSDIPVVITDPQIGSLTITGVYSGNDLAGFLRAVALAFNLEVKVSPSSYELLAKKAVTS